MATILKNLSAFSPKNLFNISSKKIAIVVAEWNQHITEALYKGAEEALLQYKIHKSHILRKDVPGSFELPLAAQWMAQKPEVDAVLCLGCIIQGETRHFDFISDAVAHGIMTVGLTSKKPIIFGVLTTQTEEQAMERAGGKHGNKGTEAAITAIKMLNLIF